MNSYIENEAYSIEQKKNFVEEYKKLPLKNSNSKRRVISIGKYASRVHIDESTFRSWIKNYRLLVILQIIYKLLAWNQRRVIMYSNYQ
jgi:hypothetical protein